MGTFAISEQPEFDPVDIQFPEIGIEHGYFSEGKYDMASYMETAIALEIIQRCVASYLNHKKAIKEGK